MLSRFVHCGNIIKAGFLLGIVVMLTQGVLASSTIFGIVYDKHRNPLPDIDVELQNDLYQMIRRGKTDGGGRYTFDGLGNGRYTVKVYAFRYDLEDQSQEQEINTQNIRGGEGSGFFTVDFYLNPRKGGLADVETSVVFAQETPDAARKSYVAALDHFEKKRTEEGIAELHNAIVAFPDYYLALHRMGKELFILKKYKDSIPYLFKAMEVNEKSATNLYYLGSSLHKLGKEYNKAALTSLRQANVLAPSSIQILWMLGSIERAEGDFAQAEKHLLQAKKLAPKGVPEIHQELAQLYSENLKQYANAADELELYIKAARLTGSDAQKINKIIKGLREKANAQSSND